MNLLSRLPFSSKRFAPLAAMGVVILLFFNKMAFSNLILARGDTFLYFYPYWRAAADALRSGRAPLWNPNLFMGVPFLANSQVGFSYPFNWPFWLLLPTPYAVSASILLHLFIAGWGTYLTARRALSLSRAAAWLSAVLFTLGGYFTAQVEHVNQLQGLAWLPWLLLVISQWGGGGWRRVLRQGTAVAILFSLQLLAGHTQTAFITGVGGAIYLMARAVWPVWEVRDKLSPSRRIAVRFPILLAPLAWGVALAFIVTAVQLLPTLELAQYSSRQGGLPFNEVLSFSLHPLLLARSLLPAYGQSLFTEYVASLPLSALALAVVGAGQWRRQPALRPIILVTAAAFLLALGRFTPLYWLLANLPGFNLFRVPARWLVVFSLGSALLAGVGLDWMRLNWRTSQGAARLPRERPLRWAFLLLLFLIGWSWLSVPLTRFIPVGPEAPAEYPSWLTTAGWLVELILLFTLVIIKPKKGDLLLYFVPLVALFLATRSLPYNNLTTPEAYFDWRPTAARLVVKSSETLPAGRILSLSNIFFDPGDQAEIDSVYAGQLDENTRHDYTVAIKQKEIMAPNLPLAYGLSSVDGFDGGVLPLNSYSELMRLILPNNIKTVDGRLREYLTAVPQPRWLDLFNARFLITDKTGDAWRTLTPGFDLFFDLQHPVMLAPGNHVNVGYLPGFPATGIAIVAEGEVGVVEVTTETGQHDLIPERVGDGLWLAELPRTAVLQSVSLLAPLSAPWQIAGMTLVNEEELTFQPLVPGQYRLIFSGDVKIYENLDVLPRAFLVAEWEWQPDAKASLAVMRSPEFKPGQTAVLVGQGPSPPKNAVVAESSAAVLRYEPEVITIQVDSNSEALLLLTDAYYPGWNASIDEQAAAIFQADGFFRAIMIPAGRHVVELSYTPRSYANGRLISAIGIILCLAILGISTLRHRLPK